MNILCLRTLFTDALMVPIKTECLFATTNNVGYKMKHILTREHLVNDGGFYMKKITISVGI